MKKTKRNINPVITLQREKHQALTQSLNDKINALRQKVNKLELQNWALRNENVKLKAHIGYDANGRLLVSEF